MLVSRNTPASGPWTRLPSCSRTARTEAERATYHPTCGGYFLHAAEELAPALTIAKHIDYLGGMPTDTAKAVELSEDAETMLRADLSNESDTTREYRERLRKCEAMGEFAIAEDIREIVRHEQEHLIDLATTLGEDAPDPSRA